MISDIAELTIDVFNVFDNILISAKLHSIELLEIFVLIFVISIILSYLFVEFN